MIDFDEHSKNRNNYTNHRIYIAVGICLVYKIHIHFLLEMVHYTAVRGVVAVGDF